jgi:hypothetical protein
MTRAYVRDFQAHNVMVAVIVALSMAGASHAEYPSRNTHPEPARIENQTGI